MKKVNSLAILALLFSINTVAIECSELLEKVRIGTFLELEGELESCNLLLECQSNGLPFGTCMSEIRSSIFKLENWSAENHELYKQHFSALRKTVDGELLSEVYSSVSALPLAYMEGFLDLVTTLNLGKSDILALIDPLTDEFNEKKQCQRFKMILRKLIDLELKNSADLTVVKRVKSLVEFSKQSYSCK